MAYTYLPSLILHNGLMQAIRFNAPLEVQRDLLQAETEALEDEAKLPKQAVREKEWPDEPFTKALDGLGPSPQL